MDKVGFRHQSRISVGDNVVALNDGTRMVPWIENGRGHWILRGLMQMERNE
jgi:hypothetical protein